MDFLSKREAEVMKEVLKGYQNKVIAENLFVTEKTVKFHLTNIYKKLGVISRHEMAAKYYRGEITPDQIGPYCWEHTSPNETKERLKSLSEQKRIKFITETAPSEMTTLPVGNQSLM